MTVARAVLPLALCGAISTLAALLIRHGRTGRHTGTQAPATTHRPKGNPMARRRTYTRTCANAECRETSFIEYTAHRDLDDVSPTWKCHRHSKPNEILSTTNPETLTTLTLHPHYVDGYDRTDPPKLLGYFWGPEDAEKGHHGIVSGPGFQAIAKDFPPGTRLVVTARIELPEARTA